MIKPFLRNKELFSTTPLIYFGLKFVVEWKNMKNLLKNVICFLLNLFSFLSPKNRATILMYHSIGRNNVFSTVLPESFERQMNYLKKGNYNVMGLGELVDILEKKQPISAKTVVISFDDGYADNFIFAWPILKRCGFPATIFLTTGLAGGVKIKKTGEQMRMLDWPEIEKMQKSGLVDFQPHTVNHPHLSEVSSEEAQKEIAGSLTTIEERLGKKEKFFAYPYGDYNQDIIDILRTNGFRAALIVKRGLIKQESPLFELPRIAVSLKTSLGQFKSKLNFGI